MLHQILERVIHYVVYVIFCLLSFVPYKVQSQQLGLPFTEYINPSTYNAGMQNFSIVQDSRGFIYLANNFGLLEFDGYRWQLYSVRGGSKVRDVAIDHNGRIYIAAQGEFGYFEPDQRGFLTYTSFAETLSDEYRGFDEVWNVFVVKDRTYFCTSNSILFYENDKLNKVERINTSTKFYYVNNILYYQEEGGSLNSISNGSILKIVPGTKFTGSTICSILPYKDNQLTITTSDQGFFNGDLTKISLRNDRYKELQSATINVVVRLRNSDLAFGTQNNGLYIYSESGKLKSHLNKGRGLEDRTILSIMEDTQGNLWLGHNNGITIVELSLPFSYINEELGLPGSGYDAFSSENDLFLATNTGLFRERLTSPRLELSLIENTNGQAYSLKKINGTLLMGHHSGSYQIEGNKAVNVSSSAGAWTFLPRDEYIICGTYKGLQLLDQSDGSWNYKNDITGFSESSRVMEFDDNGDIWMSHGYKGVYRLKLNSAMDSVIMVDYYSTENGLPSQVLNNVYKIGGELLFTTISGLYVFDYDTDRFVKDERFAGYTELNSPLNVLADDPNQNIYFLGQEYIGLLEKKADGKYKLMVNMFNKIHPLLNDDLDNVSVLNSNNILFGAKEGFIVYNPSLADYTENEFETFIRTVEITSNSDSTIIGGNFFYEGKIINSQPDVSEVVLDYKHNSLRFTYTANFMNDSDETSYQYMLEGFEDDWSLWQSLAEKEYTNLKEGLYRFHVRAKNVNNVESNKTVFKFEVLPPWYRSNLAYGGYFGAFAIVFFAGFVLIDRKYRKSKEHLEITKQQEIEEIDSKLKIVTKESAQKIEKLTSEKLQSELEIKNVELASSTMSLINKNEFISKIKNSLSSLSSKSKSSEVQKELSRIVNEIDRNISNDDDWHQFEFHFNKVHGDFTTRITSEYTNLSAQDIRLCSYLRLNLSTKEIANLLNISVRGVEIGRYRLRKKLILDRSDNLSEFILNY